MPPEIARQKSDLPVCRFCEDISTRDERTIWNQPLFESPNFVVVPSLGAMVEGWLLIAPRAHFLSTALLPADLNAELAQLQAEVSKTVETIYGPFLVFEHGSSKEGRTTGCSVDHAHIHIVPFKTHILEAASQFLPTGVTFRHGTLEDCRLATFNGHDYLYLEVGSLGRAKASRGNSYVATSSEFQSQVFRKAIAMILGIPTQSSWREHCHLDKVVATIARLQAFLQDASTTPALASFVSR